ncbi:TonB-dependent receptor [Roseateles terrae]|uniref:Iron complex outermembrane receptor protein n=1 Tax=Roseateles terrae TaxID=431060 RepID=A0ABR6GLA4_9BURK|nr:TonB-dependent receptor [Roseateles terrae]MBB3192888.1 iron complex outermembrane receptor protein [Roseateles terrae]OWQ89854.1 TonB-dependent receptor [Roseateles terrae]
MHRFLVLTPLASACIAVSALAQTAPADTPSSPAADAALTLGAVRIDGRSSGALDVRRVFSSVDILGASLLEDQHVDYSWELLTRAPGVQVTQFKQGTDAGRFSFRGFNGEGRVNAVKLLIDGIPGNDNAGGMPYLDAVFPLEIERIAIVRGTNDARYGLHNIAGNADVITRQGGDEGFASLTVGSFGTREVQIAKAWTLGDWQQNYFIGWRDSDGYRDHAQARKQALSGKWFYTRADLGWRAGLTARYFHNDAQESGYLTREQAEQTPRLSPAYASTDGGERSIRQVALHLDGTLSPASTWTLKLYGNNYENQRFVRFSAAGVQQERDNHEQHTGLLTTTTWRPSVAWAHEFALEGGIELQWQQNEAQRYRTVERVRSSQFRDWDFNQQTQGAYLQALIRPVPALTLIPALRVEHLDGTMHDRFAGKTYAMYDYGWVKQPKFSVIYALTPDASVYANWGRTFQVGSGIDAYRTQDRNLRPSLNTGWESGLKWRPLRQLEGRLAYWEQRASGEVARVLGVDGLPDAGGNGNVGRTLRRGLDLQLSAQVTPAARVWATYSRQRATIETPDPTAPQTAGKEIENVPHSLVSGGWDWLWTDASRFSLWAYGQGGYFLERTNTQPRTGQAFIVNASVQVRATARWTLQLQVKNLADRRTVYGWYDSGSSGYSPADGRSVSLSADTRF